MRPKMPPRRLSHDAYAAGWICPLPIEQIAAMAMLDEKHESLPQKSVDHNVYKLGSINGHNVVIAGLPEPGNCSAAIVVTQMRMTYPKLKYGLLVGIGGGVPVKTDQGIIRLGHVVVSKPTGIHSGAMKHDHGKAKEGHFERTGSLNQPPEALLNAAQALEADRESMDHDPIWENTRRIQTRLSTRHNFQFPGAANDHLYQPDLMHQDAVTTGQHLEPINDRNEFFVVVHRGTIASGEWVIKDAEQRDHLAKQNGLLCFEMEAAGALAGFPCMVIRGISDYCDSHKNDVWHGYAAGVAAAYARQLFFHMPIEHGQGGHESIREQNQGGHESIREQNQECMRALYRASGGYESQRDEIDAPAPGTCEWVRKNKKFSRWLNDDSPSLLWITGNPGCGKTVLSKYLVDYLVRRTSQPYPIWVCSFFFKGGNDMRKESYQALCALLHQAFTTEQALLDFAREEFIDKGNDLMFNTKQLWSILCAPFKKPQREPCHVIYIIDALDECSESSRDSLTKGLISAFSPKKSQELSGYFKVLITSRPSPDFTQTFKHLGDSILKGEDEVNGLSRDIRTAILYQTKQLKSDNILTEGVCNMVTRELLKRADMTFLWSSLVIESIRRLDSRKQSVVKDLISSVPPTLDAIYEGTLSDRTMDGRRFLQFLLASSRPLSLGEMNVILGISQGIDSLRTLKDELEPDIAYTVKKLGGAFIRIIQDKIHFVHQTAREFLLHHGTTSTDSTPPLLTPLECNLALGEKCIRFLLLDDWITRAENISDYENSSQNPKEVFLDSLPEWCREFYAYSAKTWFNHVQQGVHKTLTHELEACIRKLCDRSHNYLRLWWICYAWPGFYRYPGETHIHHTVYRGDLALLANLLSFGQFSITEQDSKGFDVLAYAAEERKEDIVLWILEKYPHRCLQRQAAMMSSLLSGNLTLSRLLVQPGVDLNARHIFRAVISEKMSPIEAAAASGQVPVLEFLRENGAAVDKNAFDKVITEGHISALQWLISHLPDGRDGSERMGFLQYAMKSAAANGRTHMMSLVEKQGASLPNKSDISSGLGPAGKRGDIHSVRQLVSMGGRDSYGHALRQSTRHPECLRVLLEEHSYISEHLASALETLSWETPIATLYCKLLCCGSDYIRKAPPPMSCRWGMHEETSKSLSLLLDAWDPTMSEKHHHKAMLAIVRIHNTSYHDISHEVREILIRNFSLVCLCCSPEMVDFLLSVGADVNLAAPMGFSPLLGAVLSRDLGLVKSLLERGALPDEICSYQPRSHEHNSRTLKNSHTHSHADSPEDFQDEEVSQLEEAASALSWDMIETVWQSIWLFLGRDGFVETPLSLAEKLADAPIITALRSCGREENTSCLRWALRNSQDADMPCDSVLKRVLSNHPLLLRKTGYLGQTMLHRCATSGSAAMIETLVSCGAILPAKDKNGKTPLHTAVASRRLSNVEALLKKGADKFILDQDMNGRTCLHDSLIAGDLETSKALSQMLSTTRGPLGSHWSARSESGRTLLHEAVYGAIKSGESGLVDIISVYPDAVNCHDKDGYTELHHAVLATTQWNSSTENQGCIGPEIVRNLILRGSDYQRIDNAGLSPLEFSKDMEQENPNFEQRKQEAIQSIGLVLGEAHSWGDNTLDQTEMQRYVKDQEMRRTAMPLDDEFDWWDGLSDDSLGIDGDDQG